MSQHINIINLKKTSLHVKLWWNWQNAWILPNFSLKYTVTSSIHTIPQFNQSLCAIPTLTLTGLAPYANWRHAISRANILFIDYISVVLPSIKLLWYDVQYPVSLVTMAVAGQLAVTAVELLCLLSRWKKCLVSKLLNRRCQKAVVSAGSSAFSASFRFRVARG